MPFVRPFMRQAIRRHYQHIGKIIREKRCSAYRSVLPVSNLLAVVSGAASLTAQRRFKAASTKLQGFTIKAAESSHLYKMLFRDPCQMSSQAEKAWLIRLSFTFRTVELLRYRPLCAFT